MANANPEDSIHSDSDLVDSDDNPTWTPSAEDKKRLINSCSDSTVSPDCLETPSSPLIQRSQRAQIRRKRKEGREKSVKNAFEVMSAAKNNPVGSKAKPERVKKVRKFTSVVWEMFSFIRDGDGKVIDKTRVQCKRCGIVIAYSSSTSNMRSHMSSCSYEGCVKLFGSSSGEGCGSAGMTRHGSGPSHTQASFSIPPGPSGPSGDVAKERENPEKYFMHKYIHSMPHYKPNDHKKRELDRSLARLVVDQFLSLKIVDSDTFKDFSRRLDPRYSVPSRNSLLTNTLYPMMHATKQTLKNMIMQSNSIALTTDGWTSMAQHPYISLTLHVIDENFDLKEFLLGTIYTPESHTSENLIAKLEGENGVLSEWGLLQAKKTYVTDNASNIKKAIVELSPHDWLGCLGHTTNLMVQKGLEVARVVHIMGMAKNIVKFIKSSTVAYEKLKQYQVFLGLPKLNVLQEVCTRWNSCLNMLKRLVQIILPVMSALLYCSRQDLIPPEEDIEDMKAIADFLEMFEGATQLVSGEKYATLNFVKPVLDQFNAYLAPNDSDNPIIKDMKQVMLTDLVTRYQDQNVQKLLNIGTILDPRFRYYASENEDLQTLLIDAAVNLNIDSYYEEASQIPNSQSQDICELSRIVPSTKLSTSTSTCLTSTGQTPTGQSSRRLLDAIFAGGKPINRRPTQRTLRQKVIDEVHIYFNFPDIYSQDIAYFDPLNWWKTNHYSMSLLSRVFKHYFCIPATSVPSERSFSMANNVCTKKRSKLTTKHVDMLTFLKANVNHIPDKSLGSTVYTPPVIHNETVSDSD